MFDEAATRLFTEHVQTETLVAAEDGTWPAALWSAIEANGMTTAATPESAGGIGASWSDAQAIIRASGRCAVPAPVAESLLANRLLGRAGLHAFPGVLGAIGFTYEHALHFTTRRLWSWRSEFVGQAHWSQVVGEAMCAAGSQGYWPLSTGTEV